MPLKMSRERDWLEKMHTALKWSLVGPNIRNPFDSHVTPEKIEEYSNDRSALMEVCQAQAVMDDTSIIKITDLTNLKFETLHPNLMSLAVDDLNNYLTEKGIWNFIVQELKRMQKECQTELARRSAG